MGKQARDIRAELAQIDEQIMAGLKPFQRATTEHIAHLFKSQKRVLLADEVGLGKTLVARGVVSKVAGMRSAEGDDLVKVVYICANGSIANQNVQKLRIDADIELSSAQDSRLSMQHLRLAQERCDPELKRRYVQITPLTPGTSFKLSTGTGTMRERALIYATLSRAAEFSGNGTLLGRLRRFMWSYELGFRKDNWDYLCDEMDRAVREASLGVASLGDGSEYPGDFIECVRGELADERVSLADLAAYLEENGPDDNRSFGNLAIASLRRAFSKASMDMMDPDFVIMDEFQRFRDLISDNDTETSLLAKRFFSGDTRVLLLSATPFRMYTTPDEDDDEEFGDSAHEFLQVVDFLTSGSQKSKAAFQEAWSEYGHALVSATLGDSAIVVTCKECKENVQESMLGFMARTERTSTEEMVGQVQGAVKPEPLAITEDDIAAYFALSDIGSAAGVRSGLISPDYVKSCPYPLSFMRGYEFKRQLTRNATSNWTAVDRIARKQRRRLWVNWNRMSTYKPIDVQHARYQRLKRDLLGDSQSERLLWVPPSMPYYKPNDSSPFAKSEGFSKTLVFSSWAMVPPAVATLLSYEAEQKNVASIARHGEDYRYFQKGDDDSTDSHLTPRGRLHLAGSRPDSFVLAYPSQYLADAVEFCSVEGEPPGLERIRSVVSEKISADLAIVLGLRRLPDGSARSNLSWYAYAELALDRWYLGSSEWAECLVANAALRKSYPSAMGNMKSYVEMLAQWSPSEHMSEFPGDLVDALVDAAIGSPAVCALRTYAHGGLPGEVDPALPFEFGYSFVMKMNTADATTCIAAVTERRNLSTSADAHWKHVLDYCCEGNFQAVLDEYFHLVFDGDVVRAHKAIVGDRIGNDKTPSLHKAEGLYEADTYPQFKQDVLGAGQRKASVTRLHMNYAAGFMESRTGDGKAENRRTELRAAFNSPFRPFVLISTSVGQEGLDFHQYCRQIVHWNLPSSPIDFEQREGRINRYKNLAVRQTLARRYGDQVDFGPLAWDELLEIASEKENGSGSLDGGPSGLLPYWGVRAGEDVSPIVRLVYNYPFSRDGDLYDYLLTTIAEYRAVMGQPNQEELLGILRKRFANSSTSEGELSDLFLNLCPYCHLSDVVSDSSDAC